MRVFIKVQMMKLFLQLGLALSLALAGQVTVAAPFEAGLNAMDREHYATEGDLFNKVLSVQEALRKQ